MKSIRRYSFAIRVPERTWVISLRRIKGKPRIKSVRSTKNQKLKYKKKIIGDKLILILSEPSIGVIDIDFIGNEFKYYLRKTLWIRLKNFFKWVIGKGQVKMLPPAGDN